MRPGVRLGVDVGTVRIGIAVSDADGRVATPVETVRRGTGDLDRIAAIAATWAAAEVVVGLPLSLSGAEGPAARAVRDYSVTLAVRVAPVPVRLVDERLSTVSAERGLRSSGVDSRRGRAVVDRVAAAQILQAALDTERTSGWAPGETVAVAGPHAGRP